MSKKKKQRGLVEPITHIRKPFSIQMETGEKQGYRLTLFKTYFN